MDTLSPDIAIRLGEIFTPHWTRLRGEVRRKQGSSQDDSTAGDTGDQLRFAHYTTAEAALSIIGSKRIWMRNTTCMSDYSEVQHGFDILLRYFDKPKTKAFADALDKAFPGAAMKAINVFNQQWSSGVIPFNTYVASISVHDNKEDEHGRLSMWRGFGGKAARVALVFKVPWVSGGAELLKVVFSPVAYLAEKEAHAVIDEVIENVIANCDFLHSIGHDLVTVSVFVMLLVGVTCLKHEGFREEREWRAIYSPKLQLSPLVEPSIHTIGGVPQTVYNLPLDATVDPALANLDFSHLFDRLIIGPSPYPWAMYEAFVQALTQAGVPDAGARVVVSGIPIRS